MIQGNKWEFLCSTILLFVKGTSSWEFCKTCNSANEYCEFGCCGEGDTKHCCENKIAIGVGTAFAALVVILVASGAFLIIMQRRYYKVQQNVKKMESSTQYDKDPSSVNGTVYVIGRDLKARKQPREIAAGAQGGSKGQPPPGAVLNIVKTGKKQETKKEAEKEGSKNEDGVGQNEAASKETTPQEIKEPPEVQSRRPSVAPQRGRSALSIERET